VLWPLFFLVGNGAVVWVTVPRRTDALIIAMVSV
jgi:hypothetical protein